MAETGYQDRAMAWMGVCFPETDRTAGASQTTRMYRCLEEVLELMQAGGMSEADVLKQVAYTFGRPKGEMQQELGGVMLTLAVLAGTYGLDMDAAAEHELARVNRPEMIARIRGKQATKPSGSPLPGEGQ